MHLTLFWTRPAPSIPYAVLLTKQPQIGDRLFNLVAIHKRRKATNTLHLGLRILL